MASHRARCDSVPALCTHRPSLLPIECTSEILGLANRLVSGLSAYDRKRLELVHLEEVKVVTRFP